MRLLMDYRSIILNPRVFAKDGEKEERDLPTNKNRGMMK
jgi:hypothetical protein